MVDLFMQCSALLCGCGRHRYRLSRCWDASLPTVCSVMLNPSTADAFQDDPTIRRCIGFARAWGYGELQVVNLYSLRTPSPAALKKAAPRNGPDHDAHLFEAAATAARVVVAWGNHGTRARVAAVLPRLRAAAGQVLCLGQTKTGAPRHPLYVPAVTQLVEYAR